MDSAAQGDDSSGQRADTEDEPVFRAEGVYFRGYLIPQYPVVYATATEELGSPGLR